MNNLDGVPKVVIELHEKLQKELENLSSRIAADIGTLWLYDITSDEFGLPVRYGVKGIKHHPLSSADLVLRPGTHKGGEEIVNKKEPVITDDVRNTVLDGPFVHREGIVSNAGYPIVYKNKSIGVLFIGYRELHPFISEEKQIIDKAARQMADLIIDTEIFKELRDLYPIEIEDTTLKTVSDLAFRLTKKPVAIWLVESDSEPKRNKLGDEQVDRRLGIRAMTGVTLEYFREATANLCDVNNIISRVMETGEEDICAYKEEGTGYSFRDHAISIGWKATRCFPIKIGKNNQGKTIGVIEILGVERKDLEQIEWPTLRRLANIASAAIEIVRQTEETRKLADIAKNVGNAPNVEQAMSIITQKALEITYADSSAIFLFDKKTKLFEISSYEPKEQEILPPGPRREEESIITRHKGNSIIMYDISNDIRSPENLKQSKFNSLIGVRFSIRDEGIGDLYVYGKRSGQFKPDDVRLLETLAADASAVLSWGRLFLNFLDSAKKIDDAIIGLFSLDHVITDICGNIQQSLNFDLAAMQLIDKEKQIIETICGTGEAKEWAFVAKHSLVTDQELIDIQADVAQSDPPRIEIIAGFDSRLDKMIYDKYYHKYLGRAWIPMVLIRDRTGKIVDDWLQHTLWKENLNLRRNDKNGLRIVYELQLDDLSKKINEPWLGIIGTIEVGYKHPEARKNPEAIIDPMLLKIWHDTVAQNLARQVSDQTWAKQIGLHTLEIYKHLLPYALETIAENTRQIINADFSTLHFFIDEDRNKVKSRSSHASQLAKVDSDAKQGVGRNDEQGHRSKYVYEVGAGDINQFFFQENPPRENGLGDQAINAGKPMYIPDRKLKHNESSLEELNLRSYQEGTRAMAAFPLQIEKKGVLYVNFKRVYWFTEEEINWLNLFAKRAVDAIRHATNYTETRDNARRLANLHKVAETLVSDPEMCDLLETIAGSTLNLLTADLVTIYEYIESEKQFPSIPTIMGRSKVPGKRPSKVELPLENESPPVWMIENKSVWMEENKQKLKNKPLYCIEYVSKNPIFFRPDGKNSKGNTNFILREGICSVAGVLLNTNDEVFGVMFINYRRHHQFSEDEENIIEMLASTAAIAIQNRRLLEKSQQDLMVAAHQLQGPLWAAITNLSYLCYTCQKEPPSIEKIKKAQAFVEDAQVLTKSIYNALSYEAGIQMNIKSEDINVYSELSKLCDRLQITNFRRNLKFEYPSFENKSGLSQNKLWVDRVIFTCVIYSLINNVMKYAKDDSTVFIEFEKPLLKIRNTSVESVPLNDEDRDRLFDKFVKGENVSKGYYHGGVGIGLWVARQHMRSIGGDLELSKPDNNSPNVWEFVIHFPSKQIDNSSI